jgi:hypothetical protein
LWSYSDIHELATAVASICLLLTKLASLFELSIGDCVSDKFSKNAAKYPVALARGKSSKYTVYADQVMGRKGKFRSVVIASVFAAALGFALGYRRPF